VVKGSSSLNLREKWTIALQGTPSSHAWNFQRLFRSNRLPFIPTHGSEPPQATVGPNAHPMCRTYACRETTRPYSLLPCNTYSYTSNRVTGRTKIRVVGGISTPRADWLLGLLLTIFRGMWLVLSTLNHRYHTLRPYQIQQHRRGTISTMIPLTNPVRHPYSDYKNVNITTAISRE
jgi:hypothetical protein